MKKSIVLLLVFFIAFTLFGCKPTDDGGDEPEKVVESIFVSTTDKCVEGAEPYFILRSDKTFEFHENAYSMMYIMTGTWVQDGNTVKFTVTDPADSPFKEFSFTSFTGGMASNDDFSMTRKGEAFLSANEIPKAPERDDVFESIFVSTTDKCVEGAEPYFILRSDKTFEFHENAYSMMYIMTGTWVQDGNTVKFTVTDPVDSPFKEFSFTGFTGGMASNDDLSMTQKGEAFLSANEIPKAPEMDDVFEFKFVSNSEEAKEGYKPYIILKTDHTFLMKENIVGNMTSIYGTYKEYNGEVICEVDDNCQYYLREFKFYATAAGLEALNDMNCTKKGDFFLAE